MISAGGSPLPRGRRRVPRVVRRRDRDDRCSVVVRARRDLAAGVAPSTSSAPCRGYGARCPCADGRLESRSARSSCTTQSGRPARCRACRRGWALHEAYGRLPWAKLVEPPVQARASMPGVVMPRSCRTACGYSPRVTMEAGAEIYAPGGGCSGGRQSGAAGLACAGDARRRGGRAALYTGSVGGALLDLYARARRG